MDAPDDAAMMAAALGFSSFGSQNRPQKRRKYNPHADAAIDSHLTKAEQPKKAALTGSNLTPLGAPPISTTSNADEIDLDDDDDEPEATTQPAAAPAAPSIPSPALVRPAGLPERPAPGTGFAGSSFGGPQSGSQMNHGGSQRPWYEDYYDPSFNENPWHALEASLGLQPLSKWHPIPPAQSVVASRDLDYVSGVPPTHQLRPNNNMESNHMILDAAGSLGPEGLRLQVHCPLSIEESLIHALAIGIGQWVTVETKKETFFTTKPIDTPLSLEMDSRVSEETPTPPNTVVTPHPRALAVTQCSNISSPIGKAPSNTSHLSPALAAPLAHFALEDIHGEEDPVGSVVPKAHTTFLFVPDPATDAGHKCTFNTPRPSQIIQS